MVFRQVLAVVGLAGWVVTRRTFENLATAVLVSH